MKRNLFRDVLRDTNSKKYSMTKLVSFTTLILLIIGVGTGIGIMIYEQEVDHILIGELIALLLTLLGFKNFKNNFRNTDGSYFNQTPKIIEVETDELKENERDEIG